MKHNRTIATTTALLLWALVSGATIITQVYYPMGEAGSMAGGLPQDVVGGYHFAGGTPASITTATVSPSPVSGTYVNLRGNSPSTDGAWAPGYVAPPLPTDNFAVEMWARTSDDNGLIYGTAHSSTGGTLKFEVLNGNWGIGIVNVAWITVNDVPVTANTWTHLAYIRSSGTSRAYIDGVEYGTPTAGAPAWSSSAVLGLLNTSARNNYAGDVDELRVFSFDPGTDDPIAALNLLSIPEPASLSLTCLAFLMLVQARRLARRG